ncbi:MAG TPA: hypothetical protein VGN16_20495 [Acidobacteriaceae bacterium]
MRTIKRLAVITSLAVAGLVGCRPQAILAQKTAAAPVSTAAAEPVSQEELGNTQEKLMRLLEVSPTLADVLSADPSLLANQEYISRTNPELAQFLTVHPEVTRNPSFWLFSELKGPNQRGYRVLRVKEGFERQYEDRRGSSERILNEVMPVIAMIVFCGAFIWLLRLILENRRWKRVFTLQNEIHTKLIDRFASNQELLGYMESESGRRFLEATPIAIDSDQQRLPNLVSRVVSTLQFGTVLTLLGAGCLALRNSVRDGREAMLVLGMLGLMPGIGLILSAGFTWVLGKRLGLIDKPVAATAVQSYER